VSDDLKYGLVQRESVLQGRSRATLFLSGNYPSDDEGPLTTLCCQWNTPRNGCADDEGLLTKL
jgi:hypothetical protein